MLSLVNPGVAANPGVITAARTAIAATGAGAANAGTVSALWASTVNFLRDLFFGAVSLVAAHKVAAIVITVLILAIICVAHSHFSSSSTPVTP